MREFIVRAREQVIQTAKKATNASVQGLERLRNPFEKSDIVPVARSLINEGYKLLNGKHNTCIFDPDYMEGQAIIIVTGKELAQKEKTLTKPELIIFHTSNTNNILNINTYYIYPRYVRLTTLTISESVCMANQRFANASELSKLLLKLNSPDI